jgi:hypothetical protein
MVPGEYRITGNAGTEAVPVETIQDETDRVPEEILEIDFAVPVVIEADLSVLERNQDIHIAVRLLIAAAERAEDTDHRDPETSFQIRFMLPEEGEEVCHGLNVWEYSISAINAWRYVSFFRIP